MDIFERLAAPFPAEDIEWRIGATTKDKSKGMALAYITARAVMDRLDAVLGPTEWQDSYQIYNEGKQLGVLCNLSIRVGGEWISKEDGAPFTDFEAFKGGVSDALKRAAVKFGLGRYLYKLPATWVPLRNGRMDGKPSIPAWALPSGKPLTPGVKANSHDTPITPEALLDLPPVTEEEQEVRVVNVQETIASGKHPELAGKLLNGASEAQNRFVMVLTEKITAKDSGYDWDGFWAERNANPRTLTKAQASKAISDLLSKAKAMGIPMGKK